jgi:alpha-amylase/alpha-mannosidase (GH57 family)
MIRVLLFWHMHQPYYKDLIAGEYRLPWTRLHALKDYYGMVAMVEEFPEVHMTFNLVPSLVKQIQEYSAGLAQEPVMDLAFGPVETLSQDDRLKLLNWLFQANYDRLIARYPRYRQLHGILHSAGQTPEKAVPLFTPQDFADLKVLSQLAWFDEMYLQNDPVIRALVEKGRSYSVEDQEALRAKHQELLSKVLPTYKAAQDRGQVELTTSPFYHPILPLICDTETGTESNPGARMPRRFHHPEDARLQLVRAIALHEEVFGQRPRGLWPSEGSVSDEALSLAAGLGFSWAATDEGVLSRTLQMGFPRDGHGVPGNADALYAGYNLETAAGPLRLYFRDHQFSDLVGFVYSNMDAHDAAADLLRRIRRAAAGLSDPVVPIILDGENAWEYYHQNGREFLRAFYRGLAEDQEMRAVTGSEALAEVAARRSFTHIVPGSWINANFDIWIAAPEDHRAWNLLSDARDYFTAHADEAGEEQRELAREELLIAEGSDWCWWYGPEHHSANDPDFDSLFRAHLSNVYRALGAKAPLELATPIAGHTERVFHARPRSFLRPRIDGRVTTYFEWLGAGLYCPDQRTASMHGRRFYFEQAHYGVDERNFYLRLDFLPGALAALKQSRAEVHVKLGGGAVPPVELVARLREDAVRLAPAVGVEVAVDRIFELRAGLQTLGLLGAIRLQFQGVLVVDGLPVDVIPAAGWLDVETAEPGSVA